MLLSPDKPSLNSTPIETSISMPPGNLGGREVRCTPEKVSSWVVFVFSLLVGTATVLMGAAMCSSSNRQWALGGTLSGMGVFIILTTILLRPKQERSWYLMQQI